MSNISENRNVSRNKILEMIFAVVVGVILLVFAWFEAELFRFSESLGQSREFFSTLIYCALINFNLILMLIFGFLIFRNITKLVVDRRKGVIGSRLRSKLVVALVFFAIAPTVLLFYVSSRFMVSTFENWFSERIQVAMQETRNAGSQIYKQDQKRLAYGQVKKRL